MANRDHFLLVTLIGPEHKLVTIRLKDSLDHLNQNKSTFTQVAKLCNSFAFVQFSVQFFSVQSRTMAVKVRLERHCQSVAELAVAK